MDGFDSVASLSLDLRGACSSFIENGLVVARTNFGSYFFSSLTVNNDEFYFA